jgi:hypothetical protein
MSANTNTVPAPDETNRSRAMVANFAGWLGLILLVGYLLYWGVTGANFDLPAKVLLILGLLALGAFGLLNPQGIIDIGTGRGTRNVLGTALIIALGIGILVIINVLYGEVGKRAPGAILRADLTESQQNTLSEQSIKVARDLTETVNVYGFFGQRDASEISQQRTAENLLKEYQKYTNKLQIRMINPDVDPSLAYQYGLTRADVVVFDNGRRHEQAASNDETGFTGALLLLRNNVQKKVAILNVPSVLSFTGSSSTQTLQATAAQTGLTKENYVVLPPYSLVVSPTISPAQVDVLIVPPSPVDQPLSQQAATAISDYLDKGGHVLLIGDPAAAPLPASLLKKYGLTESRGLIIEQNPQNIWGNSQLNLVLQSYPDTKITSALNGFQTAFRAAEPIIVPTSTITGFTVTPFLQSSSDAVYGVISGTTGTQQQIRVDPNGPAAPLNIGVTVETTVDTTTPVTGSETTKPPVTRLVVVGDADFLSDDLTSQPIGNLDLFYNTVNWLSQSEERISVRPKDTTARQLFLSGEQSNLIAWSTIVFLPLLVLLGGGYVWWRRR